MAEAAARDIRTSLCNTKYAKKSSVFPVEYFALFASLR